MGVMFGQFNKQKATQSADFSFEKGKAGPNTAGTFPSGKKNHPGVVKTKSPVLELIQQNTSRKTMLGHHQLFKKHDRAALSHHLSLPFSR